MPLRYPGHIYLRAFENFGLPTEYFVTILQFITSIKWIDIALINIMLLELENDDLTVLVPPWMIGCVATCPQREHAIRQHLPTNANIVIHLIVTLLLLTTFSSKPNEGLFPCLQFGSILYFSSLRESCYILNVVCLPVCYIDNNCHPCYCHYSSSSHIQFTTERRTSSMSFIWINFGFSSSTSVLLHFECCLLYCFPRIATSAFSHDWKFSWISDAMTKIWRPSHEVVMVCQFLAIALLEDIMKRS